jgi:hypothetical protein
LQFKQLCGMCLGCVMYYFSGDFMDYLVEKGTLSERDARFCSSLESVQQP